MAVGETTIFPGIGFRPGLYNKKRALDSAASDQAFGAAGYSAANAIRSR
jgi:hypothetical protein